MSFLYHGQMREEPGTALSALALSPTAPGLILCLQEAGCPGLSLLPLPGWHCSPVLLGSLWAVRAHPHGGWRVEKGQWD